MLLEPELIELPIVEGAEFLRRTTEGMDKPELRGDDINEQTKPRRARKLKAVLGFKLNLSERIASSEKVRVQTVAAERRKSEIAAFIRLVESPAYQVTAVPEMFSPGHDVTPKRRVGSGPKALQSAFFDEFIAELTESKSRPIVIEDGTSY